MKLGISAVSACLVLMSCASQPPQTAPAAEVSAAVSDDGSLQVAGFKAPFSSIASPEAKAAFIASMKGPRGFFGDQTVSIEEIRRRTDEVDILPSLEKQRARYPVTMTEERIGGVFVQVFTPTGGVSEKNRERVLIDLHGGSFMVGALSLSQVESIPIAAVGRIKVISIDYRQGPEHRFPAASEDVAAVYRELLKTYKPGDIAIYGGSAGGLIAAQAVAWFQKENLPKPAAVGIFCASARNFGEGDSAWITPHLGGVLPAPGGALPPYFIGANPLDPLVLPGNHPATLAKFPPTMLVSGSRAGEMSSATRSHIELVKAGVDARLFIWDGLGHCFFNNPDLPEAREFYDLAVAFFDESMDKAKTGSRQ